MNKLFMFLLLSLVFACAQDKKPIRGETEWQRKLNAEFKDASTSPLKDKDRTDFEGLEFYPVDSTFVVQARLTKLEGEQVFKMKTTTDRLPEYIKYGEVHFKLNGQAYKLNVFRSVDLSKKKGYADYLFLPFLDDTNGNDSYGGGRYIELSIPDGDTLTIDFNQAYNPYCAYNDRYSCPIVPRENYLPTEVKAGVLAYKKH